jgi:hypothetical protein
MVVGGSVALAGPAAGQAQTRVGVTLGLGLDPLLSSEYPAGTPKYFRSFTPGYRLALGANIGSAASGWSGDVRVSANWRNYEPDVICALGGACAGYDSRYRALGLEGHVRYVLRRSGLLKPYLGGGAGLFATRLTEVVQATTRTESEVRPAVLGTLGFQLGRGVRSGGGGGGGGGLFVEVTLVQMVGATRVARLLPVQVGWRW